MRLSARGYYDITSLLRELADELCEGRIVYTLEGGYDPTAQAWSVRACLDALLGNPVAEDPLRPVPQMPGPNIEAVLAAVKRADGME